MLIFAAIALLPQQVLAAAYGRGGVYNDCSYKGCTAIAPAATQATLPSGLKISVNLVDGQIIPKSGYKIVVTPLNGEGLTFKYADFYIDGTLVQAGVAPDQTGTAAWDWNPALYPGSVVKVVVTDVDGSVITQEFKVRIRSDAISAPITAAAQPTGLSGILYDVSNGAEEVIRALPRPVVYGFPYILFVLLGVNAALALLQAKRELTEYRKLQEFLARLRAIGESKKTFLELVSHYLRTPITIISGGIDMLEKNALAASKMADLQAVNERLHSKIELLIGQVTAAQAAAKPPAELAIKMQMWRQPGLFIPLLLIGLMAFGFTYLTSRVATFSINQVNVAIQIILFLILAVMTYQIFRRIQLRKRDAVLLQQIAGQETAAAQTRDDLIAGTAQALAADLQSLDQLVALLGVSQAANFIHTGRARLDDLMTRFLMVSCLRGAHSDKAFTSVRLQDLLDRSMTGLQQKAAARGVKVASGNAAASFPVQDITLLAFVLHSLVDNALVYSAGSGTVRVEAKPGITETLLTVTDNGAGIPPEKQCLLFQPFSKAEQAETFNHEGIGLSLYIDKLIMTYLGGAIDLDSKPGQTTVTVHLPVS